MQQHSSRVALVTGAAGGIGRAVAEHLALDAGAIVCIVDRDESGARAVAENIEARGGRAAPFIVDLAVAEAIQALLVTIDRQVGSPDIVVNNAGIAATIPVLDYPLSHWQMTMAINVTAPFLISRHALLGMKEKGWGRIVNVASISGVRAGTGRLGYGTSKAALLAMTRQFAIEAAEWGVTVNAVAPGPIETPMVKQMHGGSTADIYKSMMPMRRYGKPDEIAHAIDFLVSENSSFITGETIAVDGGFLASGLLARDLFDHPEKAPVGNRPAVAATQS
jgi:NAD(P)-dependent dehydrogenase (short-subunit alcohol dehydrogenase family)